MKVPIFLVVETGYEGIEQLCWATTDPKEAIEKKEEAIEKQIKFYKGLYCPSRATDEIDKEFYERKRAEIETPERQRIIADFFCIQMWDGKEFHCVCRGLNVQPSKPMWR